MRYALVRDRFRNRKGAVVQYSRIARSNADQLDVRPIYDGIGQAICRERTDDGRTVENDIGVDEISWLSS